MNKKYSNLRIQMSFALAFALAFLFATLHTTGTALADENTSSNHIVLNQNTTVDSTDGSMYYDYFTPDKTQSYLFTVGGTEGWLDVYICDSSDNFVLWKQSYQNVNGTYWGQTGELQAGETYCLKVITSKEHIQVGYYEDIWHGAISLDKTQTSAFAAEEGRLYKLNAFAPVNCTFSVSGQSTNDNLRMFLYDESGQQLDTILIESPAEAALKQLQIKYDLETDHTYYLQVWNRTDTTPESALTIAYEMKQGDTVITEVTGITATPANVTLEEGMTQDITTAVLPEDATFSEVGYEASDDSIVSLHSTGDGKLQIKALKAGSCDVTVYNKLGTKHTATIHVMVRKSGDHVGKTTTTKATLAKNGSSVTTCTICGKVVEQKTYYYPKTIDLSETNYVYNGQAKKPTVTVKGSDGTTIASSNYSVTYDSGATAVGQYRVTITFKGNYSGTVTKTYRIVPAKPSLLSVKAGKKQLKIKWKKQKKEVSGYEIQYALKKNFSKAKTKTVNSASKTSLTLKKLKAKKKYYVRIRAYKKATVNGKSTRIYSAWSTAKNAKTKK